ncbi:MAG: two-component system sensor histidine kinase NtrB [Planctomycetota bacterium]|jgi:PAS domain S-box-containing protein
MFKETSKKAELIERIHWLIRLRWIAILGLFVTTYIASSVFNVVSWVLPLYVIGVVSGLANTGFLYYTKVFRTKKYASVQKHAGIQIMWDLLSLTCLIYFGGGVENPFILYFLFHVIIAGILLEKIYSYLQAIFATCLFALLILLEYYSVIPHQHLNMVSAFAPGREIWHSEEYILGIFFALASTIFISVYFVTSIMDRLRKSGDDVLFEIRSTIENMAEGVVFVDPGDKVTMCNKAIERTWNIKREEIIGKSVKDNLSRYLGVSGAKITEKSRRGIKTSQHQEIRTENGYLYNTYSAVHDNDGKYWGTVLTSHDITARKKLEQQLLHTERLATIGEMSAKVAHEIKNPLSSISLNTELLHDEINHYNGDKTNEAEEMIQSIMKEVDRLTDISEEYLQFARFPKLELKSASINDMLIELTRFLKEEMFQRNIVLEESYAVDLPEVLLDENQIRQVFFNVLKNSFDAMPEGGRLDISTGINDNNNVEVCIADSGSGIAEEDIQRIYDPFYSNKVDGTGLGLALTKKTIEVHGGEISCDSTVGVGTTIHLVFQAKNNRGVMVG